MVAMDRAARDSPVVLVSDTRWPAPGYSRGLETEVPMVGRSVILCCRRVIDQRTRVRRVHRNQWDRVCKRIGDPGQNVR
ncbi:MAG: hypothetical protein ACI80K_000300 [Paracoccaceae bacterium]|jgi:hypothetical protein